MKDVVDDDEQPTCEPWCSVRMETRVAAFGSGRASRPWAILEPRDVASQVPAIYHEMCASTVQDG